MGYTPLFDTLLSGTLYGRWPHTGVWACLLSRATREGVIDEIPQSLAAAIGVPADLLMECITDFMAPDKFSRTASHDGRRLELIDPQRPWGWRIINHGKYREKARKSAFDAARVQDGSNAERMAARRAAADEDPTGPDATRADPLSSPSPSPSQTEEQDGADAPDARKSSAKDRGTRIPEPFPITDGMRKWFATKCPHVILDESTEEFVRYWKAVPGAKGRKCDWEATWQNRMTENEARAVRFTPRTSKHDLNWRPTE